MFRFAFLAALVCSCFVPLFAQNQFEKRRIAKIDIVVTGTAPGSPLIEEYRLIVRDAVGSIYSTPRIRDAIEALYNTRRIDTITVTASIEANGDVDLLFTIKPKTQAQRISIILGPAVGDKVTEQDLMFKLNLLTPGTVITEQTLRDNADEILDYLRERGFYRSEVTYEQRPLGGENEVGVTFRVNPNVQATVEGFRVNVTGFEKPFDPKAFKLKVGGEYSRDRLISDVAKVREILRKDDFLAPTLEDPRVTYDSDRNTIAVEVNGRAGPKVSVAVDTEQETVSEGTQNRLLPVRREGTLDYAAIIEGERRLENYYQEKGYFFNDVTSLCTVKPQISDIEGVPVANETTFLCSILNSEDLLGREVEVHYRVNLDRRLKLTEIRIRGTDKITIEDVRGVLGSQEANILGIVPVLGYGRGYTSASILEADEKLLETIMSELGYRQADVVVNRGVTPNGEDLIITFLVNEGPPYVVNEIRIAGNSAVPTADLLAQLPPLTNRNYSRARERNAVRSIREYYSNLGYYDARITSSMIESAARPDAEQRDVAIEFRVENEGKKVVINRVLPTGNEATNDSAILKAVTLEPGEFLRAKEVYTSEQNLYGTDAFERVEIRPQPAGETPDGDRLTDVIVNVDEQPARLITYGGGFSTDLGLSGFFDVRHVNLFGNLWQGGARVRVSQRQQLVQFDFVNPRFLPDGEKRFAPLTFTALYQRDSTVTRFFRSTFDQGTFGIVQRLDEEGNPIDEFGNDAGDPTINRAAVSVETSRTISRKNRSLVFLKYRFEDVRLFNFESLLIKELLRPDSRTRISGFGVTFVRDTRRNCNTKYSILDLIAKGDQADPCRYSAGDPTHGQYVTADYNVSFEPLGANIGFQKFQASYNFYRTFPRLRNTTFAARGIIGLGHVFSGGDRFTSTEYPALNGLLPISERFYAGGSNNLRGFDFEEAGPRVVIVPTGTYRNSDGEPVFLDPFTVPFGGNALAVVNLEARIPLNNSIRAVPFYDGGNVFRKVSDIFKSPELTPGNVAEFNQRAVWTHTAGLGLRIKTPVGGEFGVDYARLLNPPIFAIPQSAGGFAFYKLRQDQIHFRFSQAF